MTVNEVLSGFDCVEFKQRVQAQIYEQIKDLSPEEEIEFFRKAEVRLPIAGGPSPKRVRARAGQWP